ncbi:serendipity locus protein alpha [Drosophila innubila]|uniref:serendipity locus protein alpha n=1 Tax=Drosophila innubila TaxID=198719 RepID=UPI00148CD1EB|nr:serendipity locus protein alpha [Drosophila innubila]
MEKLFIQLSACTELIEKGSTGNICWLNKFCAAFHKFASDFKLYLPELAPKYDLEGNIKIHVETIFLCFTQVLTCITQLERTINIEENLGHGAHLLVTRTHFLERIDWCVRRLHASLYQLYEEASAATEVKLEDLSFVELLDLSLDKLESYNEIVPESISDNEDDTNSCRDLNEVQNCGAHQLYTEVNHIVKHALAFANVALASDKKALSSICETVLDECTAFERNFDEHNPGERKLEALSLQRALYSLETYLNEALLRLIFTSFFDIEKVSVIRLKNILQLCEASKTSVDKLISDFDVNMDRIQQIGVIAIAFTEDVKTKTIVRSCLASLESLDSCILPAFQLQTTTSGIQHADILEHHFKEELVLFRNIIHEIIDSRALMSSYLDILAESIHSAEKLYPKDHLLNIAQMGNILHQHFQLKVNYQALGEDGKRLHQDFVLILRECQAVLELSIHVDPKRIIKRFKILCSVLAKLRDAFGIIVNQGSACATENSLTMSKNFSSRHRSFTKPRKNDIVSNDCGLITSDSGQDNDLISFQLTEILKIS